MESSNVPHDNRSGTKKKKSIPGPSGDLSSQTKFVRRNILKPLEYEKISKDEYMGKSESISGSSDTYQCDHGKEGRQYTERGLLKRYFKKKLDPTPDKPEWKEACLPSINAKSGQMMAKLAFLVLDATVEQQIERLLQEIQDYCIVTKSGFKITELSNLRLVLDFLINNLGKIPILKTGLESLIRNMNKPVRLNLSSDVVTFFGVLQEYMAYLGYMLMILEDDSLFDLVGIGVIYQISGPDSSRGKGTVRCHQSIAAAASLHQISGNMISVASARRFPVFLNIALLLAYASSDYCLNMMEKNVMENIFCRFNPYFPDRKLPDYDINPRNTNDYRVKLGDSSLHLNSVLCLLLVLIKTTKEHIDKNPEFNRRMLPCPDNYAQLCFIWAYRFECRAQANKQRSSAERISMTSILIGLVHLFEDRLQVFNDKLMPDVLTLSVLSELPPRDNWTSTVPFNTSQLDVQFKILLLQLSISFIKAIPNNLFMIESHHWLLGLMYLLDPGLCQLRARWVPSLYSELKKMALQTLVLTLPLLPANVVQDYGLIRRILWFIEWYTEIPYELPILYWSTRLLKTAIQQRSSDGRVASIGDLADTHGIIVIMKLCHTLLDQKIPPIEKSQVILGLCLRILTSCVEHNKRVKCIVYPDISWPSSVNSLARRMLHVVLHALEKNNIICDRWLISLLNYIWEAIIWKDKYRHVFVQKNGIYHLLDLITMTRASAQCIALAIICDIARAGEGVGYLVTWRASQAAFYANPTLVKQGATIATLLAAIFQDDCRATGVKLDENGVIQDMDFPLMSSKLREMIDNPNFRVANNNFVSLRTSDSMSAAEMAGLRMSKVFAILHLLSKDLEDKVSLVDDAYKLYRGVKLSLKDEVTLVLCSHYLTMKLMEVSVENQLKCHVLLADDEDTLNEFLHIGRGWSKEIKRQQETVLENQNKQNMTGQYVKVTSTSLKKVKPNS